MNNEQNSLTSESNSGVPSEEYFFDTHTWLRGIFRIQGWWDVMMGGCASASVILIICMLDQDVPLRPLLLGWDCLMLLYTLWSLSRSQQITTQTKALLYDDFMAIISVRNHLGLAEQITQTMSYADVKFWMYLPEYQVLHFEGRHLLIKMKNIKANGRKMMCMDGNMDALIISSVSAEEINALRRSLMKRIEIPIKSI